MAQTERSRGWEIGSRVTVNSDYTFATMFGLLSDYPIPTPALPLKGREQRCTPKYLTLLPLQGTSVPTFGNDVAITN